MNYIVFVTTEAKDDLRRVPLANVLVRQWLGIRVPSDKCTGGPERPPVAPNAPRELTLPAERVTLSFDSRGTRGLVPPCMMVFDVFETQIPAGRF